MTVPATPVPATPDRRDQAAKVIANGLTDLVFESPGIFRDRPGFINGGGGTDPLSNTVRTISQLNCRVWASRDKSNFSPRVNAGNANLCGPYLTGLGENPLDGAIDPPFLGGQCAGDVYSGTLSLTFDPSASLGGSLIGTGPVTAAAVMTEPSGNPNLPLNAYLQWTVAEGTARNTGVNTRPQDLPNITVRLINQTNNADPCGNPPADTIRAPSTVTPQTPIPPRITVNLPGFGDVTVNVDNQPSGDPIFCVEELDRCITIEVDGGGGSDGGGGGGGAAVAPTSPGTPGGNSDTGAGGDAEGEAGEDEELTGLRVAVVSAPGNANVFDNVSAQVFRGVGYVAMGYPGLLGVDTSAAVVESPQFFHAQQRGLTAWRVRANVGFNLRVTPYYRSTSE